MAEMLVDSTKLDACLDAEADAIRAKTGGSTDIAFDYANNKGFADAIAAIPSGAATIENGMVFKTVDSNKFPLTVDFYGTRVVKRAFYNYSASDGLFKNLTSVTLKNTVTAIESAGFQNCSKLEEINNIENVTTIQSYEFAGCSSLRKILLPKCTAVYNNTFNNCTSLTKVQLGSVGYGVSNYGNSFSGCTQEGLTIEYWIGSNAIQYFDIIVTRTRSQATKATIVMMAATALTYNGTSYAAGDTILTSEVTA